MYVPHRNGYINVYTTGVPWIRMLCPSSSYSVVSCFTFRQCFYYIRSQLPTQSKWLRQLRLCPGLDEWSSIPGRGNDDIFLFATASRPALGPTQPPIQWVPGSLTPGAKRPERETDNSPQFSAEVKNAWSYTSTHTYVSTARCLRKRRLHCVVIN
jgi:hypothetical protein